MIRQNRGQLFRDSFANSRAAAAGIHAESATINNAPLRIAHHDLLFRAANLDADTGHGSDQLQRLFGFFAESGLAARVFGVDEIFVVGRDHRLHPLVAGGGIEQVTEAIPHNLQNDVGGMVLQPGNGLPAILSIGQLWHGPSGPSFSMEENLHYMCEMILIQFIRFSHQD